MKIRIENGLPLVTLKLVYQSKSVEMTNVLFDTGCATTIFDTDLVETIGLKLDLINGTAKRMYGIGGRSELCYEQTVSNMMIGPVVLPSFRLQLGMTREPYGFDGLLGIDFIVKAGLIADFKNMEIRF